jgi:hypothetical protein
VIKIKKSTSKKRRKNGINLVKDCKDDDEFNDKDSKDIIPIKEYAKPFKEKSKRINCKLFPKTRKKDSQKI